MEERIKHIRLYDVPDDIYKMLLAEQSRIKLANNIGQFSLESTIYKLLREKCKETNNKKS